MVGRAPSRAKVRSNRRHMLQRYVEVFGAALLLCTPLFGIDRDLRIAQLYHTSWTRKDGVPSQILALAQTADGFLWIGARDGLYRFDGIHFELYQPPDGTTLPHAEVFCLLAVPDGGLWIGFTRGATSFLKEGRISTYPEPAGPHGPAAILALDDQGVIWRAGAASGLSRFTGARWEKVGAEWGFAGPAYNLYGGPIRDPLGGHLSRAGLSAQGSAAVSEAGKPALWLGPVRGVARWHTMDTRLDSAERAKSSLRLVGTGPAGIR